MQKLIIKENELIFTYDYEKQPYTKELTPKESKILNWAIKHACRLTTQKVRIKMDYDRLKPSERKPFISYIIEQEKEYYDKGMSIINQLSEITLKNGHTVYLDYLKDKTWNLLGL